MHGGDEHHSSPDVKNCLSLLLFLSFFNLDFDFAAWRAGNSFWIHVEGKGGAAVSSAEQRRATQKSD
jgi:hypothetical protein